MEFFAQAAGMYVNSNNPYVYEAGTPSYLFIALCVLELFLKLLFFILLMTGDDFQDCSTCWILLGSVVLSLYFVLFLYSKQDLTLKQRYGPLKLLIQPVVYIALLNMFCKIYVAYDLSECLPGQGASPAIDLTRWSGWMVVLIAASVAIDIALLWIGTHYDVQTYDPNKGSFLYKKTRTFEERDGPLSIIESGSFRIILQNLSPEPFAEKKVEIKRKVGSVRKEEGKTTSFSEIVRFSISLDSPINPGHMVTVIPETHNELGAIKVPGYRAFAPQISELVQTRIRTDRKVLSKLTENYARLVDLEAPPTAAAAQASQAAAERQPVVSFAK